MPLLKEITPNLNTKIVVWDVTEPNETFLGILQLDPNRLLNYNELSDKRKREYLGICMCLQHLGENIEVLHDEKGKPFLNADKNISITHSHGKVAVGISNQKIGIDIEKKRDIKIKNIKHKFIRKDENFVYENTETESEFLHIIWGIKESLYKLDGGEWWNFLLNYRTEKFQLKDKYINCWITKELVSDKFQAFWEMIDDYYLVIVIDNTNS